MSHVAGLNELEHKRLTGLLGYEFQNRQLLHQALTHRSAASEHYERLEFLGDAILGMVISQVLYEKFPAAPEGDLSRMRAALVCASSLARVARKLELGDFIQLGPGELKSGGFRRESILSDVVEAVLGAIYLEAGLVECQKIVHVWLGDALAEIHPGVTHKDAKTQLQEHLQGAQYPLPVYQVEKTTGAAHAQEFTVSCQVAPLPAPVRASGSSRRKAEQAAAAAALAALTNGQPGANE